MNKTVKIVIIGLGIILALATASFLAYRSYDRKEIIKSTLAWTDMEELPETAEITEIKKEGTSFSREFTVSFKASEEDINEWLKNSPGTNSTDPIREGNIKKYSVNPSEGAQFAEVLYDTEGNTVTIHVYWS